MIDKLKMINERLIDANKDNPQELQKFLLIKEILNQENCFLKMSIEYAYSILRDLQIPEDNLKEVYLELI
jgi:hypothetical protein